MLFASLVSGDWVFFRSVLQLGLDKSVYLACPTGADKPWGWPCTLRTASNFLKNYFQNGRINKILRCWVRKELGGQICWNSSKVILILFSNGNNINRGLCSFKTRARTKAKAWVNLGQGMALAQNSEQNTKQDFLNEIQTILKFRTNWQTDQSKGTFF